MACWSASGLSALLGCGSSQGVVTLIGRVGSAAIKADAERVARATKGVHDVHNELLVGESER
ncbi:MAG TPA: BON domain-containing protein [Thermoanaerobaculia bacterium]|nr:BON domain-containing protein [Thermoanaerobaculia bacterium]